ncbi:hypothetical protein HGM15179_018197, partial [Zosterops borbonicus]
EFLNFFFLLAVSSLGREKLELPPAPLPELGKRIDGFREEYFVLEETLRRFRGIGMTVTLDPRTAHPRLRVSPDGRSMSLDGPGPGSGPGTDPETPLDGPEPEPGPGRDPSVLGLQVITAGRLCWDVQVSPWGSWALGVTSETPGSG